MIRAVVGRLLGGWEPPKLQTRLLTSSTFFCPFIWRLLAILPLRLHVAYLIRLASLSDFNRPSSLAAGALLHFGYTIMHGS